MPKIYCPKTNRTTWDRIMDLSDKLSYGTGNMSHLAIHDSL